jgi:hypothetical protein
VRVLQEFSPDIVVCLDSWVGGIRQVNTSLHLKFADSSKCIISDLENFTFEDADEKNRRVCMFVFEMVDLVRVDKLMYTNLIRPH